MPTNRERALDAAVELLGSEGLRALTHVRVDERAGLPKGSTSNHFRTRAALLEGVVTWLGQRDRPAVTRAAEPATVEELVEQLTGLYGLMTGPYRTTTAARLALLSEAAHHRALQDQLAQGHEVMLATLRPALARLGAREPDVAVQALAACFEGLFLHELAGTARPDARAVLALVVRGALVG